jgi:hypothetical protein
MGLVQVDRHPSALFELFMASDRPVTTQQIEQSISIQFSANFATLQQTIGQIPFLGM